MDKDDSLFKNTTFSDIMSDIYQNSRKKDRQITKMIAELQPLIKTAADATIMVPLIKEYLDISVKNDDHLIKLASIIQRYISTKQSLAGEGGLLSDAEKQQLLKVADETFEDELETEIKEIQKENQHQDEIDKKFEEVKKNGDSKD